MSELKLEKPIFVVGHPRSGTTLLSTILGRNSEVAMPPETQFLIQHNHLLRSEINENDMYEILASKRISDLMLDKAQVLAGFDKSDHNLKAAFVTILDEFRKRGGKRRVGEKSPLHLLKVEILLDWFPDAKIICIERNGTDVVASMMGMPWAHRKFAKHVFEWVECSSHARNLQSRTPDSFYLVSFEKFTSAPEQETRAICDFCNLVFEPSMLTEGAASTVPKWEQAWKGNASRTVEKQPSQGLEKLSLLQRAQLGTFANFSLARSGYITVRVSFPEKIIAWLTCWPYHPVVHPILRKLRARLRS